jgi:hypothetical protein
MTPTEVQEKTRTFPTRHVIAVSLAGVALVVALAGFPQLATAGWFTVRIFALAVTRSR